MATYVVPCYDCFVCPAVCVSACIFLVAVLLTFMNDSDEILPCGWLLDNSRIRQLADWTTHGLDISQTGQLADKTTHILDKSWTGQLVDATGDFACLVFVLLAASARPRVDQSASHPVRELAIRELSSYPCL